MGIFDKLKNVFFEEEEVEVEEKDSERDNVPVAKKIDVLETKKRDLEKEETSNKLNLDNEKEDIPEKEKDFKFPMGFDDKDFEVEKTIEIFGPIKEEKQEEIKEEVPEVVSDEPPLDEPVVEHEYRYEEYRYEEPVKEEPYKEEVYKEETYKEEAYKEDRRENYHKLYESKEKEEEKTGFTPSPIISPIYGILNKNYKKEEIVSKSDRKKAEVVARKDDLDIVREKAYGDLAGEISASIEDEIIDIEEEEKPKEKQDTLYDLSDESSPTVKTVTVGDAEEYFNDLGLEYNVDYKVEKEEEKETEEKPKSTRTEKLHIDDDDDEDGKNLFDLIDAMYEDENKDKE